MGSPKMIVGPHRQLVSFDAVSTVLGDPAPQFGNPSRCTTDFVAELRWGDADQFLDCCQVPVHEVAGVIGTEEVFSADMRRSLCQQHRQHVDVDWRLHQQRAGKISVNNEAK